MRTISTVALLFCAAAAAQTPDPAAQAYEALKGRRYDEAIALFLKGIQATPNRVSIRKDLAYTYLKIGENEAARDQFREAMRLDPADQHVALEYAFLCYETQQQQQARRVFDRIRRTGDKTAEQAFQNVDAPLKAGIERWLKAIELGGANFSAHYDLATLAEQRDELELAAEHFEKAWRLVPDRRSVLLDLGRVWKSLNRLEDAHAALLAASRGGQPRDAEAARELLPARYPYVYEFRRALALDPNNLELRRELAYLLLRMEKPEEAREEFRRIAQSDEADLLSAAQLGFLYLDSKEAASAMPLLERVLRGGDDDLANRVRAVLRMPQVLRRRPDPPPQAADAKLMAERSIKAGYMKDALKYLRIAHEADPVDFQVMLQLGWTYNMLHDDAQALRWFSLARKSPDPQIAEPARTAYQNLRPGVARFHLSAWIFPFYSSRWHDAFSYGQVKAEMRLGIPLRPYVSMRFVGDSRGSFGLRDFPQSLSESSFILAAGLASKPWKGLMFWGEAGSAISYLRGRMLPDYRGGASFLRGFGPGIGKAGWFFETGADAVFVSRFQNDFLVYQRNRIGYTPPLESWKPQVYWNAGITRDVARQQWARYTEQGPGLRLRWAALPSSFYFSADFLRVVHSKTKFDARPPTFHDARAGFWYAITH